MYPPARPTVTLLLFGALAATACGGAKATPAATEAPPTLLKTADLVVVDSSRVESGPILSGSLRPKTIAQLRAQAGGRVLDVFAEQGQAVTKGMVLLTLDQAALQETLLGAKAQLRSAEIARDLAKRNADRNEALLKAGAIADRDAEQTRSNLVQSEASVEDAKTRVRTAEEQFGYTKVRAPFSGVVSEQPVNPGDVVQVGAAVMTVVDPSLLELEATVPAEQYASVKRGASVSFGVGSLPTRRFQGKVDRVNPAVDSQTRQIRLYVNVPNTDRALVAGLFAEGRLSGQSVIALTVPLNAIDERDGTPSVRRVKAGRVEKVPVTLGLRDDVAEKVAIASGVARGDTLLVGGSLTISAGTQVRVGGSN
jgi:RND family efflux transporter MFP subunit